MVKQTYINFCLLFITPFFSAQINRFAQEWKNDNSLQGASIAYCVMNAKTSEVISEYNSQVQLIPASTLKIVTTSAALGILGTNFRFETKLIYSGVLNAETGVLNGDIIILGSGDPSLQSDYFDKEEKKITDKWAEQIKAKGIQKINGKVIGDASCFIRDVPPSWIWGDIGNYFGAVPCGLSFMDNKFKLFFESKEAGSRATIKKMTPSYYANDYIIWDEVIARGTEDEAFVFGDPFGFKKEVRGTIPPNKSNYEVEAALPDPALLCAEMLNESLKKYGVVCAETPIANYDKEIKFGKTETIHVHLSPTLDKLVQLTNIHSNNLYCETLLKTLGKGSFSVGIEQVKKYWQNRGVNINALFMVDGSGLSRANTLSTAIQAQILGKIYRDTLLYTAFKSSLPIAGKNGSMTNIGKGTFIENNLVAKTGYINRARGYCGYVKTKSGKYLAFSILFNNYNCSAREAKLKLEKFMIELAEQ